MDYNCYIYTAHNYMLIISTEWSQKNCWSVFGIKTPRSWAILDRLPVVQLLKNSPPFYVTWKFSTVFTSILHQLLFWARSIQSIHTSLSLWPILILSTHLCPGLPSGKCENISGVLCPKHGHPKIKHIS
jgi:hypothetical protein